MGKALKVLESASRRELQALAKTLKLCRGNAKSDVIVTHAKEFIDNHPMDGEQQVLDALGSSESVVPVTSSQEVDFKNEEQPEDEPVEKIETKDVCVETKRVTPKEQEKIKSKQVLSPTDTSESSPTTSLSAKSFESPVTTTASLAKTSFTIAGKTRPTASATTTKMTAPISKKAGVTARKAVEALVNSAGDLTFVGESRVRCSTTGHEMLADVNIINTYLCGKRYQKARNLKLSFAKYAPMFVDHPDESKTDMLWCNVTELAIARDEKRVKDHMTAPRYQKQLPIWKEQEAAKKKAEEEEKQRRAARMEALKKRKLDAANAKENDDDGDDDDASLSKRSIKRKRRSVKLDK
ncbi:unnamed protein product [Peronospora belbahrii]|uniref:SAP domain-containing protein n=1 Tax=Peronospora belbahrii TaxID=622444 RepID=A0AAU9LJE1_9STRA|nr:unnamed protein product [Peronospora belbahrii]